MSFGWLGTFRQGQWAAYRRFVLNERRDVERRMNVIRAELDRIGEVTVLYGKSGDVVTEQRLGFSVTPGTSLCKLIQAYTAQGGNPFDISLFLSPDSTYLMPDGSTLPTQPYGGVVYAKSDTSGIGGADVGGDIVVRKYWPARSAKRKELSDTSVATAVDTTRKWVNPIIASRIHDMEARIIKLCDLREQLKSELETITFAVGGTTSGLSVLDEDVFSTTYGLVKTVVSIDGVFYAKDENGVPDLSTPNPEGSTETGGIAAVSYISLFQDVPEEEDNTAL